MKKQIVIATGNPGKLKEFQNIMGTEKFEFKTLKDIGFLEEIIEDGDSFEANSKIKAQAVFDFWKGPVFADDSGLEVFALNNEPGIYSARYSGKNANDHSNNEKLLKELHKKDDRSARFACALCYMDQNTEPVVFHGYCEGKILETAQGNNGFGYDPLFLPKGANETFAEMTMQQKKDLSHRGEAIKKFMKWLKG